MKRFLVILFTGAFSVMAFSQTTYYSKSAGNLNVLATWGTNPDGSGTSPTNFTGANRNYFIVNNPTPTISGNWTVSGANSKVLVGDGIQSISFTVPSPRTTIATYSVMVNSTLTAASGSTISGSTAHVDGTLNIQTDNNPVFGTMTTGSTVSYSRTGNQTIENVTYYNLTLTGSGNKRLNNSGNTTVNGTLFLSTTSRFFLNTNNSWGLFLNGIITGGGDISGTGNSSISIGGSGPFGTMIFRAGTQNLYRLDINRASLGLVTLGSALTVSNFYGHTNGVFAIGSNTLSINGAITFPASAANGSITGSATSDLTIAGAGTITNSLFMTQSGTGNYLRNFTLNRAGRTVSLGNTLNMVGALTPTAGTFAGGGNLVLLATASTNVGRIGIVGGSITGSTTVQMWAKNGKTGWTLLGAPGLSGRTFADWDDNTTITCSGCPDGFMYSFTSIYSYSETVGGLFDNYLRYIAITNTGQSMSPGQGFWMYLGTATLNTADIILDANGTLHTGNFNFSLTMTSTGGGTDPVDHGYNLLSNPFPSPILWSALRNANPNVANAIYVYNPDLSGHASYVNGVSSPAVGSGGIGNAIPSGQGFYVKALVPSVTLTGMESNKSASTQELLKTNGQQTQASGNPMVMRLKANGHAMQFETAIYFDNSATANYDVEYDATYLGPDAGYLGIGTRLNGSDFAINGLPPLSQNYSIPVFVKTDSTDTYSISGTDLQNIPGGACVILHDNYTGLDQDLRTGNYTCTISDTEKIAARFVLNITINNNLSINAVTASPSCKNAANGYIAALPSGAGPWNYYWKDANSNIIKTTLNTNAADTLFNVNAGNYSLDVNTVGTCDNGSQTFVVNPVTSPSASFTSGGSVVFAADSAGITFVNGSSGASNYWWTFGDGIGATCFDTTHYYTGPGEFDVTLMAIDSICGDTSYYTQTVTVIDGTTTGVSAIAQPSQKMFISRDANGYYVQFNYREYTNARVSVQNVLGEKISERDLTYVSNDKVYISLGDHTILIVSVVTSSGEKTWCKIVNY